MHDFDKQPQQRSNRFAIGAAAVGLLLVALTGCSSAADPESDSLNRETVELSADDANETVTLAPGDTVIIRLGANPGTGFEWGVTVTDENVVAVASQRFDDQAGDDGSPGQDVISLVAGEPGIAEVSLEYRRPWETDVEPEEVMTVEIVVTD